MRFISFLAIATAVLGSGRMLAAGGPVVEISPGIIGLRYAPGGPVPPPQTLTISSPTPANLTAATVTYLTGAPGWLNLEQPSGKSARSTVLAAGLLPSALTSPGIYIAQIHVASPNADDASALSAVVFLQVAAETGSVPVTGTTPTPGPPVPISAAPSALAFTYRFGETSPAAQQITVSGIASADVSVSTADGKAWLAANSTNAAGIVTASVSTTGLGAGTYQGAIYLTGSTGSAQVPVTLTVTGPILRFSTSSLQFRQPLNAGLSPASAVQLGASGTAPFSVSSSERWLLVDPPIGTTPASLSVRVNDTGLAQGRYTATVIAESGPGTQVQLPVELVVGPPASLQITPAFLSFTATSGSGPSPAQAVRADAIGGGTVNFTAAPDPSSPWINTDASASTPATLRISVNTAKLAAGTYTGSVWLTPAIADASPQQIGVTLTVNPGQPSMSEITSSASYEKGAVAPGQIVSIWGTNLAPRNASATFARKATATLEGATVTFDGIPAPILFASETQIAAQVPYGIALGKTAVTLTSASGATSTRTLDSAEALPGLFTLDASGAGQAAALNEDLSINGSGNPASRGRVLVLYGTGEGKTSPPVVEGTVIPATAPFPQIAAAVAVTIGDSPAKVLYAGETPGSIAGLMQINVQLPEDAPMGDAVPVRVTIGSASSQAGVTVAIR